MLKNTIPLLVAGSLALAPFTGCEELPGDKETQGAVIGGVGGALAGGLLGGEDNRLIGALLGGALGAGGGWLIGSQLEKADDKDGATHASEHARDNPVSADQARDSMTADVNNDGYVTMDEVVALEKAGISDSEIIRRLEATKQFFELTPAQEDYLRGRGVSDRVITAMREINTNIRDEAYTRYGDRLDRGQDVRDKQNLD